MRKVFEVKEGCIAKAFDHEPTFVLLARDACAPEAIRAWVALRVATGKNSKDDPQIQEANAIADVMEDEQQGWHKEARMRSEGVTPQDIAETTPERL